MNKWEIDWVQNRGRIVTIYLCVFVAMMIVENFFIYSIFNTPQEESQGVIQEEIIQKIVEVEEVEVVAILVSDLTQDHIDHLVRQVITEEDEKVLAKCIYGEDRYDNTLIMHKAAVIWCILNRLDSGIWGDTVSEVIKSPNQFSGYKNGNPVKDWAVKLVRDVVLRYQLEKFGYKDVGRVLPEGWLYFGSSNGHRNRFRKEYNSTQYWDWSLPDPYYGAVGIKMEEVKDAI